MHELWLNSHETKEGTLTVYLKTFRIIIYTLAFLYLHCNFIQHHRKNLTMHNNVITNTNIYCITNLLSLHFTNGGTICMPDIAACSDGARGHGQQSIPQSIVLSIFTNTIISLLRSIDEGKDVRIHQVYGTCVRVCVNLCTWCASLFRVKVTNTVYFSVFDVNFLWWLPCHLTNCQQKHFTDTLRVTAFQLWETRLYTYYGLITFAISCHYIEAWSDWIVRIMQTAIL